MAHLLGNNGSHTVTKVKQPLAWLVLRWETHPWNESILLSSQEGHILWPSKPYLPGSPGAEIVKLVLASAGGSPLPPGTSGWGSRKNVKIIKFNLIIVTSKQLVKCFVGKWAQFSEFQ